MKTKRPLLLVLCLILCITAVFALASCGGNEEPTLQKFEGITFSDASFEYDGLTKTITVIGLPEGANVTYSPQNSYSQVGVWEVTATITKEGYETLVLTATLTITEPEIENAVTVTFDPAGATKYTGPATVKGELGKALEEPSGVINKEGYTFDGWYNGSTKWTFGANGQNLTEDITLTARWSIKEYTIKYILTEGILNSPNNPTTYNIETPTIVLEAVNAPEGSTFVTWYKSGANGKEPVTEIPQGSFGNITLYMEIKHTNYDIVYHLNGGSQDERNPLVSNAGEPPKALYPSERNGCEFDGWYTTESFEPDSKIQSIPGALTSEFHVYAKFTAIPYGITYAGVTNSELSAANADNTYNVLETFTFPIIADRETDVFTGWKYSDNTNATTIEAGTKTGEISVTAQWAPKIFNVIYNMNIVGVDVDNVPENKTTFTYYDETFTLHAVSTDNYEFVMWVDENGNEITEIAKNTIGDVTVKAIWKAAEYSITYNLNGGTLTTPNPAKYLVSDEFTFNVPEKFGYKFLGWYTTNDTTGTKYDGIVRGTTGNLVLYAVWEQYSLTITYDAADGILPVGNPTGFDPAVGVESFLPASKIGFTFIGWFLNGTDTEITEILPNTYDTSIELVARYEAGSKGIEYELVEDHYVVNGYTDALNGAIYIPSTYKGMPVTAIAANAFAGCTRITQVTLPSSITDIGEGAFSGCTSLEFIVIPESVINLGANAFVGCTSLMEINCKASEQPGGYAEGFDNFNAEGTTKIIVVWNAGKNSDHDLPIQPFTPAVT